MITLDQAAAEYDIPARMLRWYVKTGKMWAERRKNASNRPIYYTARIEVERAKRLYRPQLVKKP